MLTFMTKYGYIYEKVYKSLQNYANIYEKCYKTAALITRGLRRYM